MIVFIGLLVIPTAVYWVYKHVFDNDAISFNASEIYKGKTDVEHETTAKRVVRDSNGNIVENKNELVREDDLVRLWTVLNSDAGPVWGCDKDNQDSCTAHFVPNQTPAIMDPMSTRAFGHASCTGMSIYMASALRSIGIPARVVGTPAWHNHRQDGNHNWIEIYMPHLNSINKSDPWLFFGPKEGSGFDDNGVWQTNTWFCEPTHFSSVAGNVTQVAAARVERNRNKFRVDMPWAPGNDLVAGEDRTAAYLKYCGDAKEVVESEVDGTVRVQEDMDIFYDM